LKNEKEKESRRKKKESRRKKQKHAAVAVRNLLRPHPSLVPPNYILTAVLFRIQFFLPLLSALS
jgi:hypothetical protein